MSEDDTRIKPVRVIGPIDDLRTALDRHPDNVLLRWRGGEWTVTEFAARAMACAERLAERRIEPGARVAIMSRNCAAQLSWQFGIYLAGLVEVPINADLRGPMLEHILADSEPTYIVAQSEFHEVLVGAGWNADELADIEATLPDALPAGVELPDNPPPGDLATILYTSGTTGPSKGVMIPHGCFSHFADLWINLLDITEHDVNYFVMPFFHVDGHHVICTCLRSGSTLAFADRFSVRRFWGDVRDFGATWWLVIGSILAAVQTAELPEGAPFQLTRGLGGPIPSKSYTYFEDGLGMRFLGMFGQTEADGTSAETWDSRKRGSAGHPTPGFEMEIHDENGYPVPAGTGGEIVYRPRVPHAMTTGYWRRPDATLEATRGLWFHTGDRGVFDEDGFLFYRGRMTDSLRRRGENVSAYELELTVRIHEGVSEAAAIAVVDELGGEDDIKLFVVTENGADLDLDDFFAYCEKNLPRYAIPRYIEVVPTDFVVRAPGSGAIAKHRLPREHGPGMVDRVKYLGLER